MKATPILAGACVVLALAVGGEGVALLSDRSAIHTLNAALTAPVVRATVDCNTHA